jgi:DNA-binding GntR family transcriptional regulator
MEAVRQGIGRRRRATQDRATTAYNGLRTLIVEGRLAPGSPISENDIATRLKLSRTPVRTALQRLQQEGFLRVLPFGNTMRAIVSPLTAEDLAELFSIVGVLEGLAARIAATLPAAPHAALVSTMAHINDSLRTAATAKPPAIRTAEELHVRFHRSYVESAAGPRLRSQLDSIQPQVERYERVYTTVLIGGFEASLVEHDAIVEAIRSGDPDAADDAVVVNWRNGASRYAKVVAMLGERGAW